MQSFDTKDSNTLESFDRKFESFDTKDSEIHGRSRSRTNEQTYLQEEFQQRNIIFIGNFMNWISATTPSIIGIVNELKTKNGRFKMMNCIIRGIRIYSLY